MPLRFTQPRNANPLASIEGFSEVCRTLLTMGPLCALRSTPAEPTNAELSITPDSDFTLPVPVPSQSLADYVQDAVERYTRKRKGPSMYQQALLASNVCNVEDMQDNTLTVIRKQPASTTGRHRIPFLSRSRPVNASVESRTNADPQPLYVASAKVPPPGLKYPSAVDETPPPPSADKQEIFEFITRRNACFKHAYGTTCKGPAFSTCPFSHDNLVLKTGLFANARRVTKRFPKGDSDRMQKSGNMSQT